MSTFLHYVRCKDALLDCSAPGGERCESLTWVDEIGQIFPTYIRHVQVRVLDMMTSSNGDIFRVTGHFCGEFTGPR